MSRNSYIDYLRASAIVLMVVFHFIWDLNYFGHISVDIPNGAFWREFRAVIVSLFLFSMGVSLVYAYKDNINYHRFGVRLAKLVAAAALITLTTTFMMPNSWVYFGILHFIAFATVVLVGLVNKPWLALILSIITLAVYFLTDIHPKWPFNYLGDLIPKHTVDLATPFPWLALPLFGIWAAQFRPFNTTKKAAIPKSVLMLSKNSLIIYLVHQPILFGFLHLFAWVIEFT